MSEIDRLIDTFRANGFVLSEVGGRLRCESLSGRRLSDVERHMLAKHKLEILGALNSAIPAAPRQALMPISLAQRRLWFVESSSEGGPPAYNIPSVLRLDGPLEVAALEQALNQLIARHEILRTVIPTVDGRPFQRILPARTLNLPVEDIEEASLPVRLRALALEHFDLEQGPLVRARLFRTATARHHLLLLQHHIISDGWSIDRLFGELGRLYGAARRGQIAVPPLPVRQYADYAAWQQRRLDESFLDKQLAYWRQKLAGCPILDLPVDHHRPPVLGSSGRHFHFVIPATDVAGLKHFATMERTTLFVVLLAVFKLLLARYSGQTDIVVGAPIANRDHPDAESMLGFFVNILALRTELHGAEDFRTLVRRVGDTVHEAFDYQDVPFDRLVSALGIERDPARAPLFQVLFALQSANRERAPRFDRLITDLTVEADYDIAKAELTFSLQEDESEIAVRVEYNTDLFDTATIVRLATHYGRLLRAMLDAPEQVPAHAPMLAPDEFQALVVDINRTTTAYPRYSSIPAEFAARVSARPEAMAIEFDGVSLSYRTLDNRANRLARHLEARSGVAALRGTRIALCLERSIDFVVGALAAVKLGAAYVPVDPEDPPARLALVLEDVAPSVIVTHEATARAHAALKMGDRAVVNVDIEQDAIAACSSIAPPVVSVATDPAHVCYTSGTTGKPKGVMLDHRAVMHLVCATNYVALRPGHRIGFTSNTVFDVATFEIWGALLNGACLIGFSRETLFDIDALSQRLERDRIDVLLLTTGLFEQFVAQRPEMFCHLEVFLTGGAKVNPAMMRKLVTCAAGRPKQIVHCYGPTENTTFSTTWQVDVVAPAMRSLPIGRPIANATAYVLDGNGQPVPIGVPGELHVGGDGVAHGYLNRTELTAERFVSIELFHPERPRETVRDRVYRTGDIARWLPDLTLEFLGRRDDQFKIRGFRVELGEIEAALSRHPGIDHGVVRVQTAAERSQIVCYYVPSDPALTPAVLNRDLVAALPAYMVPSAYLRLDAFPVTANGKVDLRALPPISAAAAEPAEASAPVGPVETALAEVWCAVLGLDRVDRNAAFFSIGGDSILAIQVVAGVRGKGLTITPRQLFQAGTIARLAEAVAVAVPTAAVPAMEDSIAFPLAPIQQWFFDLDLATRDHFNQALLLTVDVPFTPTRLAEALRQLIDAHQALRLRFGRHESGAWVQWSVPPAGSDPALQHLDLAGIAAEAQERAVVETCTAWQSRLDIAAGPILAAGLIDGHADGRQRLFLAIHHLAIDGVSWRILLADLRQRYHHPASPQRRSANQLQPWISALAQYANIPSTRHQLAHWRSTAKAPPLLSPARISGKASEIRLTLDTAETRALLTDCGRAYNTRIDDVLLTALAVAIKRWNGQSRVRFGLEGHGREESVAAIDLSDTVGWFTSLYPVVLELPEQNGNTIDWRSALRSIKEQLRSVPDRGVGFGALRYLADDRQIRDALAALPEPELAFNYLGQLDAAGQDWALAPEAPGAMIGPRNRRPSPIDLTALVSGGRFEARLLARSDAGSPAAIAALAREFLDALRALIAHCRQQTRICPTPSDFPLSNCDQTELDALLHDRIAPPARIYGLTPLQKGLLFHALHSPESDQYVVQCVWDYASPIEPERLRLAWEQTVAQHDVLRTRFVWMGLRQPVQVVESSASPRWTLVDVGNLPPDERVAAIARLTAEDRTKGIDLGTACAMRIMLIRHSAQHWTLIWTHHHILFDGWCLPLLLQDVERRYAALGGASLPTLPAPLPFEDYVGWLGRQDRAAATDFWTRALRGLEGATDLPFRLPGAVITANAPIQALASHSVHLSSALGKRLRETAAREGVTPNTVMQLAWAVLLARYSRRDDVVFGTTVSGRANDLAGVDRMIGLAINTLPVRVSLDPSASVAAALADLHRRIEDVSHFSYLSLPEIQATSAVPSGEPMFNCLLVFENYPSTGLAGNAELGRSDMTVHDKTSLPLVLIILPGDMLKLVVNYDAAVFDGHAVERLCGNYARLIEQIVDTPEIGLSELELLTAAEVSAVREWNATTAPFDAEATVTALIESQIRRNPDAVAVRSESGTLTYRTLDEAANRLAHRLRERYADLHGKPLAPDTVIGLCLERDLGMSVGILGILKAGAAYLPLDPSYPEARLADMVDDANCALVVCDDDLAAGVPLLARLAPLRRLSLDDPALAGAPATPPRPVAGPGNLAYVIYTSGSTGRPKGAAIEHRSLVNRLEWMQHAFPIGLDDRILQKTPFSFDVSVWELLWPLLVGASLTFARPEGHKDPAYLVRLIRDGAITTVHFVPSMLQVFIEQPDLESLTRLRRLFCSGEALPTTLTGRLLARLPDLAIHNLYGPTEAAIDVSHHPCDTADAETAAVTPIGRPVWNTTLHVLDPHQRELPVGIPGELHIGGVQLARGYLNRPELTAERFITASSGVGRLYRTGDLVRRRADGAIDYLGRLDFQVKLRGIRIELGEIEAALERLPGIGQACVVTRSLGADTVLAAYYVGDRDHDQRELMQALACTLPDAMVPAFILKLDAFPLTIAGKIDRNRLPAPTIGNRPPAGAKEPRNSLEAALAGIFAEVLQMEELGIEDDFFALGGHSLTATQVVSRLRTTLGVELPVKAVFEDRTVAALARRAGDALTRSLPDQQPLPRGDDVGAQPLSFAQERLWFMHRFAGASSLYNLPTMLRVHGPLDIPALSAAVNGWIARHAVLRSRIIDDLGEPHQTILPPQELIVAVEPLGTASLDARLTEEATQPFDLANESPVRVRILRLGPDDHVLMIVQHHLVSDGWSIGLMLRELADRYAAARAGRTIPSVDGPTYFDFVRWQRSTFQGERLQRSLVYWRNVLGELPTLTLPTDRPRPPVLSYRGATVAFTLGPAVEEGVRRIAVEHGGTTFTVLLTVFKLLLARYSGQGDIVVGTPIANRNRVDLEGIPGLFVNTLVLRTNLGGTSSFATALRRVTDNALAAYAHQDMPFEVLVDTLRPERDPGRSALFQVFFILQNARGSAGFEAPDLEVETLRFDHGTSKFDLTMAFEEVGGRLEGIVEYATDLFDRATIERVIDHFQTLLTSVLAAPAIELSELGIPISGTWPSATTDNLGRNESPQAGVHLRESLARRRGPSGRTELRIAAIWRAVLGLDEIDATDSFFDLGGTSLLVMRVQARLRIELGIDLPVVTLFSKPTVRDLAALIDGRDAPVDLRGRAQARAAQRRRHADRSRGRT